MQTAFGEIEMKLPNIKMKRLEDEIGVCPQCRNQFLFLTNWHDKKMNCPICLDEDDEYDD